METLPGGATRRRVRVNGVALDVVEAGPPDGPPIVLAHGFPETSWSWRHQWGPLAAAGWHVLAPDQRGYGGSSAPRDVSAYTTEHLSADLLALVDDRCGAGRPAVFVGHDWGALLVWDLARAHPERCRAVVNVSVPYPDWPAAPTALLRHVYADRFFYILYFQEVGPAESEFDVAPRTFLRRILWSACGDHERSALMNPDALPPAVGTRMLDILPEPPGGQLPAWCSAADLDVYTDAFERSGFFGPVSWYRNLDANYARLASLPADRMTMPVWFIAGSKDPVLRDGSGIARMRAAVPGFRESIVFDGVGHWTQQERPSEFNSALLSILSLLP